MELGLKNFLNVSTSNASDLSYQEIYLNSSEKMRQGGSNNKPVWFLNNALKIEYLKLKSINLPLSWNNINDTNNVFTLVENGGTPVKIKIEVGRYNTITDLIPALQETLNNTPGTNNDYTVSLDNGSFLRIASAGTQFKLQFDNENYSTNKLFGFGDIKDTGVFQAVVGRFPYQMQTVESLFLVSRSVRSTTIIPKCNLGGVIAKIPLTKPDGAFDYIDFSQSTYDLQKIDSLVQEIELELVDAQTLKPIDLREVNWSCVLSVFA